MKYYRLISNKHSDFYAKFAADLTNLLNLNRPGINYDNPTLIYDFPGTGVIGNKMRRVIIKKLN